MLTAQNPLLRGRDAWVNQQPELFADELREAQRLGVTPLQPTDTDFHVLLASGLRFNWAVRLDGSLWVTPSVVLAEEGPVRISHAILAEDGGDVLAAGEGRAGDFLSNTTGHYKNDESVVAPVKRAFGAIGISFRR